jgi:hypothetical protein
MYRFPVCALLLSVPFAFVHSFVQSYEPPQSEPAGLQAQPSQTPAPAQSTSEANSRIQRSVEDLLSGDPLLSSADIQVNVDDHNITLTGSVDSYAQHQRVLALLQQYSRWRRIVDKLQMK